MRTSISNLNGEQQNTLCHLSKNLRKALRPLMIICYGHRAAVNFRSTAFGGVGVEKNKETVFDIFILISDDEILSDDTLMEIANRNSSGHTADNILIFRMKDVLLHLHHKNRFFASVFRKGTLLYGNKNAVEKLPDPMPPVCFTTKAEKDKLFATLQYAQRLLTEVDRNLKVVNPDIQGNLALLKKSAVAAVSYFIAAYWGIEIEGDLKTLLNFTLNINNELTDVFPCTTSEEALLFNTLNLSMKDEDFDPGITMLLVLSRRVSKMIAISQSCVQRKISNMLLKTNQ